MKRSAGINLKWILERTLPFFFFFAALWAIVDSSASLKGIKIPSSNTAFLVQGLLVMGSVLNWGLEGLKWYCTGRSSIGLKYRDALKGVFSGVAIGMWMPGKVGAWMGKLFYVPDGMRKRALYPLMVSSAAQMFSTALAAGIVLGIHQLSSGLPSVLRSSGSLSYGALFLVLFLFAGLALYFFLRTSLFDRIMGRFSLDSEKVLAFRDLSFSLYGKVLMLAFLRYLVILAQFVLIVAFYVPNAKVPELLFLIPIVLFLVSTIPSPVLAKLGVREWVMVSVLAPFIGHEAGLLMSSITIWTVNLLLPALVGALLLLSNGWRTSVEG